MKWICHIFPTTVQRSNSAALLAIYFATRGSAIMVNFDKIFPLFIKISSATYISKSFQADNFAFGPSYKLKHSEALMLFSQQSLSKWSLPLNISFKRKFFIFFLTFINLLSTQFTNFQHLYVISCLVHFL